MAISYNRLWKLLIDRKMKKKTSLSQQVLAGLPSPKWDEMSM